MTPIYFETEHAALWDAFAAQLAEARRGAGVDGALLAERYRRVCEHLALAQSRAYPIHLVARLESLAGDAHQLIYRKQDYGLAQFGRLLTADLPRGVRAQGRYVLLALVLFVLPLVAAFLLAWQGPDFALRMADANELRDYERMYSDGQQAIGRGADGSGDWTMFGFYILHNIGIGFSCFGSGILAGVGSAFTLLFNGLAIGNVAGHLTRVGLGHNFWPFVVTHSAFELTGIVLSGAAGLRLGVGWLAPGRLGRLEALKFAARSAMPLVYAAFFLLVVAAAFEGFWSAAVWIAPNVKYAVASVCWALVVSWLCLMGRQRGKPGGGHAG